MDEFLDGAAELTKERNEFIKKAYDNYREQGIEVDPRSFNEELQKTFVLGKLAQLEALIKGDKDVKKQKGK